MEFKIIGGMDNFTETPSDMTPEELAIVMDVKRLEAIKMHRQWTNSTMPAAIRCVDAALVRHE